MSVSISDSDSPSAGTGSEPGGSTGYWTGILLILVLLTEQASLAFALFTPALPKIAAKYQTTEVVWVMTALVLAAAIASPILGKLADIHGKKRILVVTAMIAGLGAFISAVAPTFPILLIGRFLSGAGFAFTALGYSLIRDVFPARLQPMSISIANTGVGIIAVAAPLISGFLLDHVGVSSIFWFSFALCAVGGLLTLFFVPETTVRAHVSVDWLGAFLLTVALFTVMLALSLGAEWGWASGRTLGTLAVTVVFAVAWVLWERRAREPLISIPMLAGRKVGITLLAGGIAYGATTLIATLMPMLLQTPKDAGGYGFGLSVTGMALWMLPGGVLIVLGGVFVGATARWIGFRTQLIIGAGLIAIGAVLLATTPDQPWQVVSAYGIIGFGSMIYAAVPNLVLLGLDEEQRAIGANFTGLSQSMFGGMLSSLGFAFLAQHMLAVSPAGPVYSSDGFMVAFLVAGGAAAIGALLALGITVGRVRR
ncbi:MFS transporter [Nocardia vermiculata]|uniref:MFS transporter n=1 Tax=Nocardia vermiculata TaxID=257274 RepID=A0A846Y933_9NOCA|nr:MFS transporter [Nocardia vermiculata]NKY54304.1 MFS transporter [Nocardia vermiculata]